MADRSVRVVLDATVSGFVGGMGAASQSAVGFGRAAAGAFDKNQRAMDTLGSSALKLGIGLTALAGFAVKAAMDWESAWTGVLKTVDGTPQQLALVEQGLRDLATSMPESHQNIAAVAEAAGQLGVARDDIVSFTRTMVMLGDTTNLTAEEAATSMAQLMNIMGTAPSQVGRLGSALVELGNNGASTERQIIEMAQRIAGAGRIVGLSEANVLGIASAVASTGVEVEAGGTAISKTLIDIAKAVATNSDDLQTWAQVAGMSAEQFAAAWKDDPAAAFLAFEQGLGKMGPEAFEVLDKLGLDGARVGRVLLNLAGASDLMAKSLSDSDIAMQQNAALIEEAGKRYDTAAAQAEIAWNRIKDAAIDGGNALLPVVAAIANSVGDLAELFGELPDEVQGTATAFAAAGGAALLAFGGITKFMGSAAASRVAMLELQRSSPAVAGAIGKVGTAFRLAAVAAAAYYALGKTSDVGQSNIARTSAFTKQLLGVAAGSDKAKAALNDMAKVSSGWNPLSKTGPITGLKDAFKAIDTSGLTKVFNVITPFTDRAGKAAEVVGKIDQSLRTMVDSGAAEQAAASLDYLQKVTGKSESQLLNDLPLYDEALTNMSISSDKAGDATGKLGDKLGELSPEAQAAKEAMDKLRQTAHDNAMGFLSLVTDFDSGLQKHIQQLEGAAKAQAEWADNMATAAARGVDQGYLDWLAQQGPAAADILDELANASEKDINRINDAFGSLTSTADEFAATWVKLAQAPTIIAEFKTIGGPQAAAEAAELAEKYSLTEGEVVAILKAQDWASNDIEAVLRLMREADAAKANPMIKVIDNAKSVTSAVKRYLKSIKDEQVIINIIRHHQDRRSGRIAHPGPRGNEWERWVGGRVAAGYWAGGRVPGTPPADPMMDNVVAFGATSGEPMTVRSREWIVNQKSSDENDNWLRAINDGLNLNKAFGGGPREVLGFADGGAWERAWRSAAGTAQGTGRPAAPSAGPLSATVDLTGVEFDLDPSRGLGRFVRGQAEVVVSEERQNRQRELTRKIARKG